MQDTFYNLGVGLLLATLLIYFLMVALFKSWLTPLVILSPVPVGLIGVVLTFYVTGTALNVLSLLGIIFMVGIVVSNAVLLVDYAQHLRRGEGLSPREAIVKAASVRVRPVIMTALASVFALLPMAIGFGRGSEANSPLGRAILGGLVAGLVTTLFVVPCLYSLVVRDSKLTAPTPECSVITNRVVHPHLVGETQKRLTQIQTAQCRPPNSRFANWSPITCDSRIP